MAVQDSIGDILGLQQGSRIYTHAALVCLALAVLLLSAGLVWKVFHPADVLVVTPFGATVRVRPNTLPDDVARDSAMRWVQDYWTYAPETIRQVQEDLLPFLHPAYRKDFEAAMKVLQKEVKTTQMSSQVKALDAAIVQRRPQVLKIRVQAYRIVWIGSLQNRRSGPFDQDVLVQLHSAQGSVPQIRIAPDKVLRDDTLGPMP